MDLGWNNYDLEVYGSRWSHLQLITVAEVLGPSKQLVRCRLRTAWTLFTKAVFWGVTGVELLVIGFLSPFFPWLWALLLTLPLLMGGLTRQERNLQRLFAVFLDEVAKQIGLVKVQPNAAPPSPVQAQVHVSPSLALKSPDHV